MSRMQSILNFRHLSLAWHDRKTDPAPLSTTQQHATDGRIGVPPAVAIKHSSCPSSTGSGSRFIMQSSESSEDSRNRMQLGIVSTEDDDNNPSSIGNDQSRRLVMNPSAHAQESSNVAHLTGGTTDDTAGEEIGTDEVAIIFRG